MDITNNGTCNFTRWTSQTMVQAISPDGHHKQSHLMDITNNGTGKRASSFEHQLLHAGAAGGGSGGGIIPPNAPLCIILEPSRDLAEQTARWVGVPGLHHSSRCPPCASCQIHTMTLLSRWQGGRVSECRFLIFGPAGLLAIGLHVFPPYLSSMLCVHIAQQSISGRIWEGIKWFCYRGGGWRNRAKNYELREGRGQSMCWIGQARRWQC